MKFRMTCLVALAAISFSACEGMSGEYSDVEYETHTASTSSPIPPPPVMPTGTGGPSQMTRPTAAPPPMTTGGPSQMPKPPQATPPAAPRPVGCSSPNVSIRTEANGAVEIKCGAPPMAPPPSLKCASPEVLTWLTRNGTSTYVCMK